MTQYFYASTNAEVCILLVNEDIDGYVYVSPEANGTDPLTGIDLYPERDQHGEEAEEKKITELLAAYSKLAEEQMLYSVEDVEDEEPERVLGWSEDSEAFEIKALLCVIN